MSVAVQCAVGDIGSKATTELSLSFDAMVNCGEFQYGLNSSGIHRLNSGNLFNTTAFEKSFTLATSDFGKRNEKRIRYIYAEIEIYEDVTFTVSVRPNKGAWISKSVAVVGAGLKKIRFTIQREGCSGTYHTIKFASTGQFRIHSLSALFIVRAMGF